VQNFKTIGQGDFVGWVPENGMFPEESEVVLNTVLSANALHAILNNTILKNGYALQKLSCYRTKVTAIKQQISK
jgi:hypothetical protein